MQEEGDAEPKWRAHFVMFCVELFKHAHGLTGAQAVRELSDNGVLSYLLEFAELESGMTEERLLDDMDVMVGRATEDIYGVVSR